MRLEEETITKNNIIRTDVKSAAAKPLKTMIRFLLIGLLIGLIAAIISMTSSVQKTKTGGVKSKVIASNNNSTNAASNSTSIPIISVTSSLEKTKTGRIKSNVTASNNTSTNATTSNSTSIPIISITSSVEKTTGRVKSNVTASNNSSTNAATSNITAIPIISMTSSEKTTIRVKSNVTASNNTSTNATTSNSTTIPLYFGLGLGTTGTRSIHYSLSNLNITSVHWKLASYEGVRVKYSPDDGSFSPAPPRKVKEAFQHHVEAVEAYAKLVDCVSDPNCTVSEGLAVLDRMFDHVYEVIRGGAIQAIHDDPYTKMIPFIINTIQTERCGGTKEKDNKTTTTARPIFLFSDRMNFVDRRTEEHPTEPICMIDTSCALDWGKFRVLAENLNPKDALGNYYSSMFLAEKQQQNEQNNGNATNRFKEFYSQALMERRRYISEELKPDYAIDFWDPKYSENHISTEELSREIWEKTESLFLGASSC